MRGNERNVIIEVGSSCIVERLVVNKIILGFTL